MVDITQSELYALRMVNELVSEAVRLVGGQTALAKLCGKKQGHVSYWLSSDHVSAETAVLIDKATKGVVSKKRLRPDLFDDSEAA